MPNNRYIEETHQYFSDDRELPSVTTIISAVGLNPLLDVVSAETLRVAAERGRIVHQYADWHEGGILDETSIDPELAGYFGGYLAARDHGELPFPAVRECRLFCTKWGYAGTLDQLIDGDWINDIKTGQRGEEHGLQLSAYWLACVGNLNDKPRRLTCTYLTRDGNYEVRDYEYVPLQWLTVLNFYKILANMGRIKPRWQMSN
ncbi:MAG: hypothetical protein AB7F40_11395 [Victivallaceae bacterium]